MGKLKKPDIKELDSVVELHLKNLRDGVLYQLGKGVLRLFYREIFNDKGSFILAYYSDNKVVGVAASAKDTNALFKKVKSKHILKLLFYAMLKSITNPILLLRLIFSKYPATIKPELLFLFVDKKFRGHGIGQKLVKATTKEFKIMGIKKYKITIFSSNVKGKEFYEGLNFKSGGQFSSFNEKRDMYYYMIKN